MLKRFIFIFSLLIMIFFASCTTNNMPSDEIKLKFMEIPFLNDKLPILDDTLNLVILKEYVNDDFKQILYKQTSENNEEELFSAIVIDDLVYYIGKIDYYESEYLIDNDIYKINNIIINDKQDVYKIFTAYGAAAFSNKYFKIDEGIPYIIAEIYGSFDCDLDEDGEMETISQVGTIPTISIYEWSDNCLLYCNLDEIIDNYYGGNYDENKNEVIISKFINGQVGEQKRYKYKNGALYKTAK